MEPRSLGPKQWISWTVFAFLLTLGVVGRIQQPEWNVTPLTATALFAGIFFSRAWMAMLLPTLSLAISNLWLPNYQAPIEMCSVYACFFVPLLFRGWMQSRMNFVRIVGSWLGSAAVFFFVTNLAVWYVNCGASKTAAYSNDVAGLMECYTVAIPFLRWMLQGDVCYLSVVFGSWAIVSRALNIGVTSTIRFAGSEKVYA